VLGRTNTCRKRSTWLASALGACGLILAGVGAPLSVLSRGVALAAEKPVIVTRQQWKARPPKLARMKKQVPREIIIHHTSVRQQPRLALETKLRGLQGFSQNKKRWGDSPYHYYIGVSGRIGEARDASYAGDTNTSYSVADRIQVVVEGHFDSEQPNAQQLASLHQLIAWLTATHNIPAANISGHNDHVSTDCPGRNLKKLLSQIRRSAAF
jgi:N-acetylmuramoyl-L-alanine amidase